MGTPVEPTDSGEVQGGNPDEGNAPGLNPAWSEALNIIPEQFHTQITPYFQQWDQAAQQRIESVNSQLKEFEDYKPFVEHGISPDELEQGVRLMYELNNNPQGVYEALANAYNFGQTPTNNGEEPSEEEEGNENEYNIAQNPEFTKLQEGLELVSKIVLDDAQAKADAEADAELDAELESLKQKHGENYNEQFFLAMMQNGMNGDEAAEAFKELKGNIAPAPTAPSILGNAGGNGVPSNAIDPTKLNGKETRNLVAEMLKRAAQQG